MFDAIKLSRQWLIDCAAKVACGDGTTYLLIQGYPATGFGRIQNGQVDLRLEPNLHGNLELEWDYYFDVRMFGTLGEWHCWRTPTVGWQARLAEESKWKDTAEEKYFERDYVLWGTRFANQNDWWEFTEERGARIWIPAIIAVETSKPPCLKMRHRVEFDKESGLAGITDAMILGFRSFGGIQ